MISADVIDRALVGMLQSRRRRLAVEALPVLRVVGYFVGQELMRRKTMKARVFGIVFVCALRPTRRHHRVAGRAGLTDYWRLRKALRATAVDGNVSGKGEATP